jgi:hypothetical protein
MGDLMIMLSKTAGGFFDALFDFLILLSQFVRQVKADEAE